MKQKSLKRNRKLDANRPGKQSKRVHSITAEEFDAKFDRGEDITPYLDLTKVRVHNIGSRKRSFENAKQLLKVSQAWAKKVGLKPSDIKSAIRRVRAESR